MFTLSLSICYFMYAVSSRGSRWTRYLYTIYILMSLHLFLLPLWPLMQAFVGGERGGFTKTIIYFHPVYICTVFPGRYRQPSSVVRNPNRPTGGFESCRSMVYWISVGRSVGLLDWVRSSRPSRPNVRNILREKIRGIIRLFD